MASVDHYHCKQRIFEWLQTVKLWSKKQKKKQKKKTQDKKWNGGMLEINTEQVASTVWENEIQVSTHAHAQITKNIKKCSESFAVTFKYICLNGNDNASLLAVLGKLL